MKIARESWVIAALGLADLVTTIVFIEHHGAEEANPLFRHLWEMGLFTFVTAKLILLACPLLILEWARKRRPVFTLRALRTAIVGYVVLYGIGFIRLNGPVAQANEIDLDYNTGVTAIETPYRLHATDMMQMISQREGSLERFTGPYYLRRKEAIAHMKRQRSQRVRQWFQRPHRLKVQSTQ